MRYFVLCFATGFGLGYIPFAPGTWGSLLGIPLAYGLSMLSKPLALLTLIAFIFFSIWISDLAEKIYQSKDASKIVIDEICGMAITLLWVSLNFQTILVAFVLFRIFDIVKIPPARYFEKRAPGGIGIVLDDVMVGIYARIVLGILLYFTWL